MKQNNVFIIFYTIWHEKSRFHWKKALKLQSTLEMKLNIIKCAKYYEPRAGAAYDPWWLTVVTGATTFEYPENVWGSLITRSKMEYKCI